MKRTQLSLTEQDLKDLDFLKKAFGTKTYTRTVQRCISLCVQGMIVSILSSEGNDKKC